jgi:hypothetical protein
MDLSTKVDRMATRRPYPPPFDAAFVRRDYSHYYEASLPDWERSLREGLASSAERRDLLSMESVMYEALEELLVARMQLELLVTEVVHLALDQGLAWRGIGEALGMSKQGAHKRYSDPGDSHR